MTDTIAGIRRNGRRRIDLFPFLRYFRDRKTLTSHRLKRAFHDVGQEINSAMVASVQQLMGARDSFRFVVLGDFDGKRKIFGHSDTRRPSPFLIDIENRLKSLEKTASNRHRRKGPEQLRLF